MSNAKICSRCGSTNPATHTFCESCGTREEALLRVLALKAARGVWHVEVEDVVADLAECHVFDGDVLACGDRNTVTTSE